MATAPSAPFTVSLVLGLVVRMPMLPDLIRNKNTRVAYYRAVVQFFEWCESRRIPLERIEPVVVGAMKVEDYYLNGKRSWVRLHEKGGKFHEVPCHHKLVDYLDAYIAGVGIGGDPKGALFRTALRWYTHVLTSNPMTRWDVVRMVRRRARDAGVTAKIRCHTFRATGIRAYLENGGRSRRPSRSPPTSHRGRRSCTTGRVISCRGTTLT